MARRNTRTATADAAQTDSTPAEVETPAPTAEVAQVENVPSITDAGTAQVDLGSLGTVAVRGIPVPDVTREEVLGKMSDEHFLTRVAQSREARVGIAEVEENLAYRVGLLMYAAVNGNKIGKDPKTKTVLAGRLYGTQEDAARDMGYVTGSKGWASKLAMIGRAAAVHGLTQDDPHYSTFLRVVESDADKTTPLERQTVKAALKGTDRGAFLATLDAVQGPAAITTGPESGEDSGDSGEDSGDTRTPRTSGDGTEGTSDFEVGNDLASIMRAQVAVWSKVRELNREDFSAYESKCTDWFAYEIARRMSPGSNRDGRGGAGEVVAGEVVGS